MIGCILRLDAGQAGQVLYVMSVSSIQAAFTVPVLNPGSVTVGKDGVEFTAITVRNSLDPDSMKNCTFLCILNFKCVPKISKIFLHVAVYEYHVIVVVVVTHGRSRTGTYRLRSRFH